MKNLILKQKLVLLTREIVCSFTPQKKCVKTGTIFGKKKFKHITNNDVSDIALQKQKVCLFSEHHSLFYRLIKYMGCRFVTFYTVLMENI